MRTLANPLGCGAASDAIREGDDMQIASTVKLLLFYTRVLAAVKKYSRHSDGLLCSNPDPMVGQPLR